MYIVSLIHAVLQGLQAHVERLVRLYVLILAFLLLVLILLFRTAPPNFPRNQPILIPPGTSITSASRVLAEHHVVYSSWLFRGIFMLKGLSSIQSGTYFFSDRLNVFQVGARLYRGVTYDKAVRITIPEGTSVQGVADILKRSESAFDVDTFMAEARLYEGYLFPDTYFFPPTATSTEVITRMKTTFEVRRTWMTSTSTNISEHDAVILASILEGEAKTKEDKEIVAGILLHRIAIHMRLQVDAPFGYERNMRGYVPTRLDIETDTPYNTYLRYGLPPTPINNPGYESLYAATHPVITSYLYYLTGSDGKMHYAKTFAEHVQNQHLYFK